ncbi:MAG: 2OG-Fe(II) oxygenase [Flavisolibacter sp.]|jgi:Rps23 Pro-64 3,4-dihydroxylase Tpa1-like proline 4-hydroxylase|nr:2OG-Fe(II) oxygenase [Flavisolibacter sp.]
MLTSQWSDEKILDQWANAFNAARPFRFLVIDNALQESHVEKLAAAFPSLSKMSVNYKGMNEHKSEHSDFDALDPGFNTLKKLCSESSFLRVIEKITGMKEIMTIHDRYGYGLHQGGSNSFLDIHVDYNLHPLEKKQRRLNLILFLNRDWEASWGGALEFWNQDVSECKHAILPLFNRVVLFECNEYSYHGYSKINCPESVTRKSFYHYYFTEPEKKLLFHDTLFKTKPKEPFTKRVVVRIKETGKNLVKTTLFHLGLNRFLK